MLGLEASNNYTVFEENIMRLSAIDISPQTYSGLPLLYW